MGKYFEEWKRMRSHYIKYTEEELEDDDYIIGNKFDTSIKWFVKAVGKRVAVEIILDRQMIDMHQLIIHIIWYLEKQTKLKYGDEFVEMVKDYMIKNRGRLGIRELLIGIEPPSPKKKKLEQSNLDQLFWK